MAERYLRATSNGMLAFTEALDGSTPIFNAEVDADNTSAATSNDQDDYVLMFVDGEPRKVLVSAFTPVRKVVVPIVIPYQVVAETVGVFSQSHTPFSDRPRKITAVYAVAVEKWGASGSTTFRIEDGGGNYQDVTIAYDALVSTRETCAIDLAAAEAFTVAITAAAEHSGVVVYAEMEIY
jgi:hypothetical protein